MSEVYPSPAPSFRRGSTRGGRIGSFARGGPGRGPRTNGESEFRNTSPLEEQGEVGKLKKQYAAQLKALKEITLDLSEDDLLAALQEDGGDVERTSIRITDGCVNQFSEVKKKGDRSRSKVKENTASEATSTAPRFGRGRGTSDVPRGSRSGRGFDRGGRVAGRGRGGFGAAGGANGHKSTQSGSYDGTEEDTGAAPLGQEPEESVKRAEQALAGPKPVKKTWANLFKPEPPAPVVKKPSPPPEPPVVPPPQQAPPSPPQKQEEPEPLPAPELEPVLPPTPPPVEPALPEPVEELEPAMPKPQSPEPIEPAEPEPLPVPEIVTEEIPEESIQQPLTEQNLEKIEDVAPPPPTETQASTAATSLPPRSEKAPPTPQARPAALTPRLTSGKLNRRALEQQEAVVMPANHAVDRATVQFGSLGLNGSLDDLDNDEEPELAETVSQPPVPSPLPQPVAALPPAQPLVLLPPQPAQLPQQQSSQQQQQQQQQQIVPPTLPTPRQAPGLPAQPQAQISSVQQHHQLQASPQPQLAPHSISLQPQQPSQISNRFATAEQTQAQKSFDSFHHHLPQQHTPQTQSAQLPPQVPPAQPQQTQQQAYGYSPATHAQQHQQQQTHQQSHPSQVGLGALTSVPDQYQNYYGSDLSRVGGFNYYPYSQPTQQDVTSLPRAGSGLGSSVDTPNQLPTVPSQAPVVSRFGAGQGVEQSSAHGTPSPGIPAPPSSQAPQPQQTAAHQQYAMQPYYHPGYYYMNQQFYPYQPFTSKQQGVYSQPHQSFTPQYTDHTPSIAGLAASGGFGGHTTQGRDSGVGLTDYGRTAVSQAQQTHPQHSSTNFGGLPNFLNPRGIPEQQQLGGGIGQQQGGQQGQSDDSLKAFGDAKPPSGPASNPSLQGQTRPGSATSGAGNLGPQQSAQPQAGMGYPTTFSHHLHGHQQQQPHHSMGAGQAYNQYSMYGQYPSAYAQSNSRQTAAGSWGQYH